MADPAPATSPAAIEARALTLAYGRHVALDGVSIDVPAAEITAFIGPNGSGKSTLLHAIAGSLRPARGTLSVLGGLPGADRARVAYVLQFHRLSEALPVTVLDVVTMGRYPRVGLFGRLGAADREAVERAMERLDLAALARRPMRELSGGQCQRVLVAQALAQDADLLLLDEPVTGLDIVSHDRITVAIAEEAGRGRTVVMTTHDLGEAATANHLVLLAGRVVASGAPDDVLTEANLLAAYGGRVLRLTGGPLLLDDEPHHPHHTGHGHH